MNIIITSPCPIECAEAIDDVRSNKFILETAQMLCTALWLNGHKATYKPTHKRHPQTIWCSLNRANYRWALRHFIALLKRFRRDRGKDHASIKLLAELKYGASMMPLGEQTPFVNCAANEKLGLSFKHLTNTFDAYKIYMSHRWEIDELKGRTPTWGMVKK